MASHPLDEVLPIVDHPKTSSSSPPQHQRQEANSRPRPEQALRCPRCDSTNTKFCYYNNYSFSQPRYFCKGCRRYWTKGGSLRNVPVGGGCRKNKRSSSISTKKPVLQHFDNFSRSISISSTSLLVPTVPFPQISYEPSDPFLSFSSLQNDPFLIGNHNPNPNSGRTVGFLDILRCGVAGSTNASPAPDGGGFHELYNGFGGGRKEVVGGRTNGVMLPFYEVGVSTLAAATVVMANGNASTSRGSVGVDSAREEYWNAVGSSIYSSL